MQEGIPLLGEELGWWRGLRVPGIQVLPGTCWGEGGEGGATQTSSLPDVSHTRSHKVSMRYVIYPHFMDEKTEAWTEG